MPDPTNAFKGRTGLQRIGNAFRYSCAGFHHAIKHEAAIREELIALAILVPVSVALPVRLVEHLILVLTMLLVLLIEFLNSAIEATVDRISLAQHPLAGRAKDLGSAAVFIALVMCGLSWILIAGPVLLRFCRG